MRLSTLTATLAVAATTALADGLIKLDYIQVEPVQNLTNSSGTILAKPVVAWHSIPYATPPLGDLRFKKPQPPTAGRGNKNGTLETLALKDYGPWCRQGPANKGESEDCLTLSIFRPQGIPNEKLPVVIWVPGGESSLLLFVSLYPFESYDVRVLRRTLTDGATILCLRVCLRGLCTIGAFNTGGGKGLNVPSFVGNAPDDFIGGELSRSLARSYDRD
jgi:hypothetical protein